MWGIVLAILVGLVYVPLAVIGDLVDDKLEPKHRIKKRHRRRRR